MVDRVEHYKDLLSLHETSSQAWFVMRIEMCGWENSGHR